MAPDVAELAKFILGCASGVGAILGTAKILGTAFQRQSEKPSPVVETRFAQVEKRFSDGDKRMDRMEEWLCQHDERFQGQEKLNADLRVELAGLRPHFENMKEAVTHLGRQAREMEGTLTSILGRLPPDK